jgi:hypothetical protein
MMSIYCVYLCRKCSYLPIAIIHTRTAVVFGLQYMCLALHAYTALAADTQSLGFLPRLSTLGELSLHVYLCPLHACNVIATRVATGTSVVGTILEHSDMMF